jgi:hypothetical protein
MCLCSFMSKLGLFSGLLVMCLLFMGFLKRQSILILERLRTNTYVRMYRIIII